MKFRFMPHIAVQVDDLKTAKEFYKNVLELEVLSENEAESKFMSAGVTFYVEESRDHRVFFAFEVDSLPEARKLLLDNGCFITNEYPDGFIVTDPHGLSYFVSEAGTG